MHVQNKSFVALLLGNQDADKAAFGIKKYLKTRNRRYLSYLRSRMLLSF